MLKIASSTVFLHNVRSSTAVSNEMIGSLHCFLRVFLCLWFICNCPKRMTDSLHCFMCVFLLVSRPWLSQVKGRQPQLSYASVSVSVNICSCCKRVADSVHSHQVSVCQWLICNCLKRVADSVHWSVHCLMFMSSNLTQGVTNCAGCSHLSTTK